jgi:hypothetical protein
MRACKSMGVGMVGGNEVSSDEGEGGTRNLLLVLELDADADPDESDRLGRGLRTDLAQLDVEAVKPAAVTEVPDGAKGAAVDWGTLLVTFSVGGGVFTSMIAVARDWLARHSSAQRIKLTIDNDTIELDRASTQEREQLISTWVRRHSGR